MAKKKTTPAHLASKNARRRLRYRDVKLEKADARIKELENKPLDNVGVGMKQQLTESHNRICELEEENQELKSDNASIFKREGRLLINFFNIYSVVMSTSNVCVMFYITGLLKIKHVQTVYLLPMYGVANLTIVTNFISILN